MSQCEGLLPKQTSDDSPHLRQQQGYFTLALQTRNKGIADRMEFLQQDTQGAHDLPAPGPLGSNPTGRILALPSPWHHHALHMEWAMGTVDLIGYLGAMACLGMARGTAAAAWLSKKEDGGQ